MKSFFAGSCVFLSFGLNELIIDSETDEVLFNGKPLNLNLVYQRYSKHYLKPKNKGKEKVCLKEIYFNGRILKIERCYDGRLFFLVWNELDLIKYRKPPEWKASYLNNYPLKYWFEQDLRQPKKIWNYGLKEKKEVNLFDFELEKSMS